LLFRPRERASRLPIPKLNTRKVRARLAVWLPRNRQRTIALLEEAMIRKLIFAAFALPLISAMLSGCVVYEGGGYYHHPHYFHDRY
jgi:hypothetical protein